MERTELVELLSPEGLRLLDSLPRYDTIDVVRAVSELRKAGHAAGLVAAALSQSRLRAKAGSKFGDFASRMLFTEAGLEQATRLRVAALHAGRFAALRTDTDRPPRIVDLGCGIGGDAMAMAAPPMPQPRSTMRGGRSVSVRSAAKRPACSAATRRRVACSSPASVKSIRLAKSPNLDPAFARSRD